MFLLDFELTIYDLMTMSDLNIIPWSYLTEKGSAKINQSTSMLAALEDCTYLDLVAHWGIC